MSGRPAPVSVGIVPATTKGHVLFIERAEGGIALPGGYVDELENASMALARESFEEMGLQLQAEKWQLFDSGITPANKLILFSYYRDAVELPRDFQPNEEVLRVISAPWNTPLVFSLHEDALRKWAALNGHSPLQLRPSRVMSALRPYCAQSIN